MSAPGSIAALAFGQCLDTTERRMCPKCLGGQSQEESLNITVDRAGGIHWICFRASCGYRGGPRGVRPTHASIVKKEPRIYTRPIDSLSSVHHTQLMELYGTDFDGTGIGYNKETDRFLLPILGSKPFQNRGYIARSLSGDTPKAITYSEAVPFIHFAYPKARDIEGAAVIVEDWFSAEKAAEAGFVGVSINGTNLNQEMINEVAGLAIPVVIAFDADAFVKSIIYQQKYREQFASGLYVAKLEKDLKYVPTDQIRELINSARKSNHSRNAGGQESV